MKIGFYSDLVLGDGVYIDPAIGQKMKETDFNCVNLECPVYSGEKKSKKRGVCLYSKAADLSFLSLYHFKAVNLANNHMMDFGLEGLQETMDKLKKAQIRYFGAGENEEQAYRTFTVKDGDKKIMIAGFSWKYTGSVIAKKWTPGVAGISLEKIKRSLGTYKDYDCKIAYFHFGTEFEDLPEPYLKKMVEALLKEDYLDVVIGNHPHCIQGIYQKNIGGKEKVCFYSLGNLMIPEGEYCKGTLRYPPKSSLGFGVIYDTDQRSWEWIPYQSTKRGRSLNAVCSEELERKISAYSEPLQLADIEYRRYYKANRNNKKRPIFEDNDKINVLISLPFLLKTGCFYIFYTSAKKLLWLSGFDVVHEEDSGGRKIVRRGRKNDVEKG
ncbi:MAG: CapA family protein [Lachnospiraceae bacterium]|nr:CapA family protein [Lachnospiraceae bacterium]